MNSVPWEKFAGSSIFATKKKTLYKNWTFNDVCAGNKYNDPLFHWMQFHLGLIYHLNFNLKLLRVLNWDKLFQIWLQLEETSLSCYLLCKFFFDRTTCVQCRWEKSPQMFGSKKSFTEVFLGLNLKY